MTNIHLFFLRSDDIFSIDRRCRPLARIARYFRAYSNLSASSAKGPCLSRRAAD